MKKFLFYFALIGWLLGLLVHVLSITGIDVAEKAPFVWFLHIGIFVVGIPVVFELKKNEELQQYQQSARLNGINPIEFFRIIFKETPIWMTIIAGIGFIYAFINFALFFFSQEGTASIIDGQYILENHGEQIKTLTKQEYHHFKATELRGFSGHWILFYGVATALLFKFSGLKKQD